MTSHHIRSDLSCWWAVYGQP